MNSDFSGKVALVTGSGRGIGAATAELLAEKRCHVVLVSKTSSEIEAIEKKIKAKNPHIKTLSIRCDISEEKEVIALFQKIKSNLGAVDIVINNAAIYQSSKIEEMTLALWQKTFRVNVEGMMLCCREAFKQMKENRKGGAIVNVSSLSGIRGQEKFPGTAAYTASKYAVVGLTEVLAVEGKPYQIRANCIAPGAVDTRMLQEAAPFLKSNAKPEDIAKLVVNLCDPSQKILTGSVLEVLCNE